MVHENVTKLLCMLQALAIQFAKKSNNHIYLELWNLWNQSNSILNEKFEHTLLWLFRSNFRKEKMSSDDISYQVMHDN
jgi:hypothetical protein